MLDYIVPIIIAATMHNATPPEIPESTLLTQTPTEAYTELTTIEVKGDKGNLVFVNNVEVGIIQRGGNLLVDLNTTNTNGLKSFTITLKDKSQNTLEELELDIQRTSSSSTDIPTKNNISDAMAYRFLNMATFGATPELVTELKTKGVEKWLEDQLNMEFDYRKQSVVRKHIEYATHANPIDYTSQYQGNDGEIASVNEYLADNDINFYHQDKKKRRGLFWHMSSLFEGQVEDEQQVRQRVAYALSQIVVASQSNDEFFYMRAEALSHYYDFLLKNAFGNYGDVLYDVSMTSAMSVFLTYEGNKKSDEVDGVTITPDENYGRELMQLFSIGLFDMNMDGSVNYRYGEPIPTYEQADVNEMSRVFTGLWSKGGDASFGDGISLFGSTKKQRADTLQPLTCASEWHDRESKSIFAGRAGAGIIEGSRDCATEVRSAIELLKAHKNMAPFISKKLIMRLAKSNPESDYIFRVASVFENNAEGVKGDLKAVTRAIFLDKELWESLVKGDATKMKEPYMKFTGMLRAFDVEPVSNWWFKINTRPTGYQHLVSNTHYFIPPVPLYKALGQAPTFSPTVFNFYSDTYEPNMPEFKGYDYVAPEIDIQTMSYIINFSNLLENNILHLEKTNILAKITLDPDLNSIDDYFYNIKRDNGNFKLTIDLRDLYTLIDNNLNGGLSNIPRNNSDADGVITTLATDWLSQRLLGQKLPPEVRSKIISNFSVIHLKAGASSNTEAVNKAEVTLKLSRYLIKPLIRVIVDSATYSVH